jgi:16S rRNA (cytidine1402-2'-O)-methyltransferase
VEGTAQEMRDVFGAREKILGEFSVFVAGIKNVQFLGNLADN